MAVTIHKDDNNNILFGASYPGVYLSYSSSPVDKDVGFQVYLEDFSHQTTISSYKDDPDARAVFDVVSQPPNALQFQADVRDIMTRRVDALFGGDTEQVVSLQQLQNAHSGLYTMLRTDDDTIGGYVAAVGIETFYAELEKHADSALSGDVVQGFIAARKDEDMALAEDKHLEFQIFSSENQEPEVEIIEDVVPVQDAPSESEPVVSETPAVIADENPAPIEAANEHFALSVLNKVGLLQTMLSARHEDVVIDRDFGLITLAAVTDELGFKLADLKVNMTMDDVLDAAFAKMDNDPEFRTAVASRLGNIEDTQFTAIIQARLDGFGQQSATNLAEDVSHDPSQDSFQLSGCFLVCAEGSSDPVMNSILAAQQSDPLAGLTGLQLSFAQTAPDVPVEAGVGADATAANEPQDDDPDGPDQAETIIGAPASTISPTGTMGA